MGISGAFGVPEEKNNGRRVIDFCAERKLSAQVIHIWSTRVCIST